MGMTIEIFGYPRLELFSSALRIKEATLLAMVCGLLKQPAVTRLCLRVSKGTALLCMELRGISRRLITMLILSVITRTMIRHTALCELRYLKPSNHALDKSRVLTSSQPVHYQSAALPGRRAIYLATDHSGLNKFNRPEDENFLLVLPEIRRMVQAAPQKIEERYRGMVST